MECCRHAKADPLLHHWHQILWNSVLPQAAGAAVPKFLFVCFFRFGLPALAGCQLRRSFWPMLSIFLQLLLIHGFNIG
jgi:hypothetical protein